MSHAALETLLSSTAPPRTADSGSKSTPPEPFEPALRQAFAPQRRDAQSPERKVEHPTNDRAQDAESADSNAAADDPRSDRAAESSAPKAAGVAAESKDQSAETKPSDDDAAKTDQPTAAEKDESKDGEDREGATAEILAEAAAVAALAVAAKVEATPVDAKAVADVALAIAPADSATGEKGEQGAKAKSAEFSAALAEAEASSAEAIDAAGQGAVPVEVAAASLETKDPKSGEATRRVAPRKTAETSPGGRENRPTDKSNAVPQEQGGPAQSVEAPSPQIDEAAATDDRPERTERSAPSFQRQSAAGTVADPPVAATSQAAAPTQPADVGGAQVRPEAAAAAAVAHAPHARHATTLSRLSAARAVQGAGGPSGASATSTETGIDRARFVGRVEGAFRAAQQRDGRVQVRLSPPELGSLRIELVFQQGALSARVDAETPAARNALLDNLPALRERLAQQDIRIEKFDVNVGRESFGQGGGAHDRPENQSGPRDSNPRPRPELRPQQVAERTATPVAAASGATALDVRI